MYIYIYIYVCIYIYIYITPNHSAQLHSGGLGPGHVVTVGNAEFGQLSLVLDPVSDVFDFLLWE